MKKKNTKAMLTRILACVLLVATLGLSLASCAAGDKVKDTANKAWDTAVDGAERIYDAAKDKITMEQVSGMAAIKLLSDEETVAVPTYAGTLTASDLVDGAWSSTNGKGAVYIQTKYRVGHIASVTGAIMSDYWSSNAGSQPIVAVDGNWSYLCVLLPAGYTDAATWASAASDFSVTVTPVIEQTLQATVLPETATDKSVSWSVSCSDANVNASDYIRLLPGDDNKVTVLALQPFAGYEFIIKCTTVIGGFTAECKVIYEGVPQFMDFHMVNEGSDTYIPGTESLLAGHTYDIKPVLGNAFWSVGEIYGKYEIVSVGFEGQLEVWLSIGDAADRVNTFHVQNTNNTVIVDGKDQSADAEWMAICKLENFFTVSIVDGCLRVQAKTSIDGYVYAEQGTLKNYVISAADDPIIFLVTVKDTVSGVSNTLKFRISDVSSVALSDSNLVF